MRRAAALASILVGGCFDPAFTDATRCGPDDTCPAGRHCVSSMCLASPATDGGGARNALILQKAGDATGSGTITVAERAESCGSTCSSKELTFGPGARAMLEA